MKYSVICFLFLTAFFAACEQETEQVVEKQVPVKIYKVHSDSIANYLTVTGSVSASEDVIVYSKVSERVDRILVKPGDRVAKGQKLTEQYNMLFEQAVKSSETAVKTAQVQMEQVKQDYERIKKLYDQQAVSPQQYEQTETQLKASELGYEQAKLQYQQAIEQFENSIAKASFAGFVASVYVDLNQMVPAGQPLLQIINPSMMKAKLKISSMELSKIYKGQSVKVKFPSIPDEEYSGKVVKIDNAVNPISKMLEIEVLFANNDNSIKSGMFGEFFIETSKKVNTVIIPENALQSRTEVSVDKTTGIQNSIKKYFLFHVSGSKAQLEEVQTGISDNGRVEITSGISIGDSIIVVGQNIVKAGQKVKVIE